jgi:putative phage-type endonuclease
MIIHHVRQGSEEWEELRKGKATASEFGRIVTPTQLKFAAGAKTYAIQKAAEILGIASPPTVPTKWMDQGTEYEPLAFDEFTRTISPAIQVGFIQPFENASIGASPDGLVGSDAVLEIKCPKAETLIEWIIDGELPSEYRLQVQGELWVTGRSHCHFYGWHPEIEPFHLVVERDPKVMWALDNALPRFLNMVAEILGKVNKRQSFVTSTRYQAEEASL